MALNAISRVYSMIAVSSLQLVSCSTSPCPFPFVVCRPRYDAAYLLDMNRKTNGNYGINEVLLASALAAIVFPVFSVQPLTFVGVTGLINLFNYTNYDIVEPYGIDYLQFQCWMLM